MARQIYKTYDAIPAGEFLKALRLEIRGFSDNLYYWDPDSRCCTKMPIGSAGNGKELSAVAARFLERASGGYVRARSHVVPQFKELRDALTNFSNKVKWKFFFQAGFVKPSASLQNAAPNSARGKDSFVQCRPHCRTHRSSKRKGVADCSINFSAIEETLGNLAKGFEASAKELLDCSPQKQAQAPRHLSFDNVAVDQLRHSGFCCVEADKDSTWCLFQSTKLPEVQRGMLEKDCVKVTLDPKVELQALCSKSSELMNTLSKLERRGAEVDFIKKEVFRPTCAALKELYSCPSLETVRRDLCAALQFKVKSHKAPGKVKPRVIHAGGSTLYAPLGSWVVARLRPLTRKRFTHILASSDDLEVFLQGLDVEEGDLLATADIESFYPSGDQVQLAVAAALALEEAGADASEVSLIHDIVLFVLQHQYVVCSSDPSTVWRAVGGGGIGVTLSGETADEALAQFQELLTVLNKTFKFQHGLKDVVRFRDDYLMHVRGTVFKTVGFMESFNTTGTYQLDACEMGETVSFLDRNLSLRNGAAHSALFVKPTHKGLYLHVWSDHPKHSLYGWVAAEFRRFAKRSESLADYLVACNRLKGRVAALCYPAAIITEAETARFWHCRKSLLSPKPKAQKGEFMPIVLKYNQTWARLPWGRLKSASDILSGCLPDVRLGRAWKNAGPHLRLEARNWG